VVGQVNNDERNPVVTSDADFKAPPPDTTRGDAFDTHHVHARTSELVHYSLAVKMSSVCSCTQMFVAQVRLLRETHDEILQSAA
jgi:hypothetical protein